MNYTLENFNSTEMLNNISTECFGDYTSIALGFLLFISEVLPFIKNKSDCKKNNNIVEEGKIEIERTKRESILHNSNGVLHTALSFYNNFKKK